MYCTKCGSVLPENSNKCTNCGYEYSFKQKNSKNNYSSIIIFGGLFLLFLLLGSSMDNFLSAKSFLMLLNQAIMAACAAFGLIITGRSGGIDLSVPNLIVLSSVLIAVVNSTTGSLPAALMIAFIVSIGVGLFNGIFVTYLRLPAIFTTLISAVVCYIFSYAVSNGILTIAPDSIALADKSIVFIMFIAVAISAFCVIFFTRLGIPFSKRTEPGDVPKKLKLTAYILSSVFACIAGIILLSRLHSAGPYSLGSFFYIEILFAMFLAGTNKWFDNRVAPIPVAFFGIFLVYLTGFFCTFVNFSYIIEEALYIAFLVIVIIFDRYYSRNIFSLIKRKHLDTAET